MTITIIIIIIIIIIINVFLDQTTGFYRNNER